MKTTEIATLLVSVLKTKHLLESKVRRTAVVRQCFKRSELRCSFAPPAFQKVRELTPQFRQLPFRQELQGPCLWHGPIAGL